MAKEYWAERQARAQAAITEKGIAETEKQLIKYYKGTMRRVIGQFEKTYDKLLLTISDGRAPTPADLYKLNTYWEMQGQLQKELQKLGDKQAALFSKQFMDEWQNIYQSIAIKDDVFFSEIDRKAAERMINQIWCADGQTWSNRIWKNTQRLQQALNDNLIDCVVAGKRTTDLKNLLQEQFGVSYNRADSIVRTEMAHIQTQAAKQRYKDAGVTEVEVWADKDERRCEVCGKLHKKRFPANGAMPIPAHPRCRCCIIPVVAEESKEKSKEELVAKNIRDEEIKFNEIMLQREDWQGSVNMIKKLTNEYNTRLTEVTLGSVKAAGDVNLGGKMRLSSKQIEAAVHEFAHSISLENLTKFKITDDSDFWREIKAIQRRYKKDVGTDSNRWISSYAHTNTDEFMAEAFTHAKLKELKVDKPSKYGNDYTYSEEVLAAVNKYFKKKKKN